MRGKTPFLSITSLLVDTDPLKTRKIRLTMSFSSCFQDLSNVVNLKSNVFSRYLIKYIFTYSIGTCKTYLVFLFFTHFWSGISFKCKMSLYYFGVLLMVLDTMRS